ncbi:MAG: hypothetical protein MK105_14405 [Crocinitomicaceae bacterium]|nr:hypothetical protein [Crocinitomicaceae bacterium]
MIKRALLFLIIVISIGWLSYVTLDILSQKSNYEVETLFGTEDGSLFIINRPNEIDSPASLGFTNQKTSQIMSSVLDSEFKTAFFSQKRNQILIQKNDNWDEASIKSTLSPESNISFSGNEFTFKNFKGRFYKKKLYINDGQEYPQIIGDGDIVFDRKSSASKVDFGLNNNINKVTDLYFLPGNKTNYITHKNHLSQGNQIKDEVLFSHVVSKKMQDYHFYERDFYASMDTVFATSPLHDWMQNGFVELMVNNKKVLISDYLGGQDPILVLNDLNQTIDTNFFNQQLTNTFPSKGKSYFVKYVDDMVVISEHQEACDLIIADFKLGNTLAMSKNARDKVYANLPKAVSERFVSQKTQYSKAIYKDRILETILGRMQYTESPQEKETISFHCEFDIADFATYNNSKSVVVLSTEGQLISIQEGKEIWKKQLNEKAMGQIQIIDLLDNNQKYTLINTSTKIYLLDEFGKNASGFPIDIDSELTNEVKFYRWKGKSYFFAANAEKEIMHYDGKGRELNIFSTDINVTRKIDVWASNRMLFAGLANSTEFKMIKVDNYKKYREFKLPTNSISAKIPNELLQFGIDNSTLYKIDQQGARHNFSNFKRGSIKNVIDVNKNPVVIVQDGNEIILLNSKGIPFSSFKVPFNEIDYVSLSSANQTKSIIGIIDGLENNVYFYTTEGKQIIQKPIEGQTKVFLEQNENEYVITTVIDQFIVQYFEN